MRPQIVLLAALALPLAAAEGDWCAFDVEGEVPVETPAGTFYVWNDLCQLEGECLFNLWIGQESNGVPGFQMDGFPPEGTPCYPWDVDGDTIVF